MPGEIYQALNVTVTMLEIMKKLDIYVPYQLGDIKFYFVTLRHLQRILFKQHL